MDGTSLNFFDMNTAMIIAFVVSIVIPLLSNIVAKEHWPKEIVGLITAFLATANGFFTEWDQSGDNFKWQTALSVAIVSFFLAVAAHYGLWKDTKTEQKLLRAGPGKNGRHKITTMEHNSGDNARHDGIAGS
jgi:protein-S-isoprenylcysteine O-methyltransferase Ste14